MILGPTCFFAGLFAGWLLFRDERTYQQGWSDCERHRDREARRKALRNTSPFLNPKMNDWYE